MPVISASKAGSRSSSSASASLSVVERRPLRTGETVPTWLARIASRPAWKAPPSESRTSASPYQLRSTTVPSGYRAGIAASLLHRMGRSVVHVDDDWERVDELAIPTVRELAA